MNSEVSKIEILHPNSNKKILIKFLKIFTLKL